MGYRLEISKTAQADLKKLDKTILASIRKRLNRLAATADQMAHLPLKGEFAGLYKLRIHGKYRAIYDLPRNEGVLW